MGLITRWGILWRSDSLLDGCQRRIMWKQGDPLLFRTRGEARDYVRTHYSYIAKRRDLRVEPHGWRVPLPVKVSVHIEPLARPLDLRPCLNTGNDARSHDPQSLSLSSRRTDSTAIRPVTVGVPHANSPSREGQHDAA